MHLITAPFRDLAWASWFVTAVIAYYAVLSAIALAPRRKHVDSSAAGVERTFVLMVPARNEAAVIEATVRSLLALTYASYQVLVIDDGSSDCTAAILNALAAEDPRVLLLRRGRDIAGKGKSSVLNHGINYIRELRGTEARPATANRPIDLVIGVVDADGRLDARTLSVVNRLFDESGVGQVQIGVKIANAATNTLTRIQDMEFVGFSSLVQVARNHFGSSGLGGNGQFTRMSALDDLGKDPWTATALSEDLDLGLQLVAKGWTTRFTNEVWVHQQGLTRWRPLLRQRTRWIQGHYQCWRHIPRLARASQVPLATRVDLINYLILVITVVVVTLLVILGWLGAFGLINVTNSFTFGTTPGTGIHRILSALVLLLPVSLFVILPYQRFAEDRLRLWEVPAFAFLFTLYSYMWFWVSIRAFGRLLLRRADWVKTPRLAPSSEGSS